MFTLLELKFVVVSVALIGTIGGSFFYGQHTQKEADLIVANKQEQMVQQQINTEQDRRNQIATDFEGKLDNLKIVNTTINRNTKTEVQKQIYTDCKLPDTGVALINNSADALNAVRGVTATPPVGASQ